MADYVEGYKELAAWMETQPELAAMLTMEFGDFRVWRIYRHITSECALTCAAHNTVIHEADAFLTVPPEAKMVVKFPCGCIDALSIDLLQPLPASMAKDFNSGGRFYRG